MTKEEKIKELQAEIEMLKACEVDVGDWLVDGDDAYAYVVETDYEDGVIILNIIDYDFTTDYRCRYSINDMKDWKKVEESIAIEAIMKNIISWMKEN